MARKKVTQVRSTIGVNPTHRGTLRALGLGRIGRTHTLEDGPALQGMLRSVRHLVKVEDADD